MNKIISLIIATYLTIFSATSCFSEINVSNTKLAPKSQLSQDSSLTYNLNYAVKYFRTILNPYTNYKNRLVVLLLQKIARQYGNLNVLDVGANIGTISNQGIWAHLLKFHMQDRIKYTGLDLSPYYFDYESHRLLHSEDLLPRDQIAPGIVGDIRNYNFTPESYNTITILDVIEHIDDPETVLARINEILPDQGNLIMTIPTFYKLDTLDYDYIHKKRHTSHVNFFKYNDNAIIEMIRRAGFRIETLQSINYLTAFPYLLWANPDFIPSDKGTDKDTENVYKKIIDILQKHLALSDFYIIDNKIRMVSNLFQNEYFDMTHELERDPRNVLYICAQALKMHPSFSRKQNLLTAYNEINNLIDYSKQFFTDSDSIERLRQITELLQDPEFLSTYGANSVLVYAVKDKHQSDTHNMSDRIAMAKIAFRKLSSNITRNKDMCKIWSKLSGSVQKIRNIPRLKFAVSAQVLKNSGDIKNALNKLKNRYNSDFELIIYDVETPEEASLLQDYLKTVLSLPKNIAINTILKNELDAENIEQKINMIKKLTPISDNEYLCIVTDTINKNQSTEVAEKLKHIAGNRISIIIPQEPGQTELVSLSSILLKWLSDLNNPSINIVLPMLVSPQEFKEELEQQLKNAWQILTSA